MKRSRGGVLFGSLFVAVILLALGGALVAFHYVPFDAPSFAVWTGIALAVASFVCVLKPARFLGIQSRLRSLVVFLVAVALVIGALVWPSTIVRADGPHHRLDDFLGEYQFREYHETVVQAPVERVAEAARQVSFADMPAAVWLMRVRALAGGHVARGKTNPRPILELMSQPGSGFLPLDVSNPHEIVYGMVGQPWAASRRPPQVTTPEQFLAFNEPGQIRVAFDIRIVDEGQGSVRLSTETRTLGNDAEARRTFSRYWRLIYPGSAIIRRVWLDAIAERARPS